MDAPYSPPPGQPYPPGYPPPRRGMGCFARGCLAAFLVLFVVGLLGVAGGWYIYRSVRPFVSTEPVAVRTFPATNAQYEDVQRRIDTFQTNLANLRAATLELSADDLNVFVARSPAYATARGRIYLSMTDDLLGIECSVPVSGKEVRAGNSGTTYYFNGKLTCDFSYANGDFAIAARKMETLDGEPAPAFIAAVVANPEFNRSLSRSFNEGFHSSLHRNPAGEAFMAKVISMRIKNNHLVITAGDS